MLKLILFCLLQEMLDKACAPPLAEELTVDSVECNSVEASVYLTKRGDVFVVAVEADAGEPPTPAMVKDGCGPGVVAWARATVTNPGIQVQVTLPGLKPECEYTVFAYAETGAGRREVEMVLGPEGEALMCFSSEPAPSGMSADLVMNTCQITRTAREPEEELDVPWEALSEEEKKVETLAALSDPAVTRAVREAAIDTPTPDDMEQCNVNPMSRNKWRSFCRWWTSGANGKVERSAFLLRECVFAAQQPEVRVACRYNGRTRIWPNQRMIDHRIVLI